jgi:hypothetical protein
MHLFAHFLTVIFIVMSSKNSDIATPVSASGDVEMQPAEINPQLAAMINRMVEERVATMEQSYREEFEVQWKAREVEADRQHQAELLSLRPQATQHGTKYVSPLYFTLQLTYI